MHDATPSLDAGFVILFGAALSFLGLGVQPPTPDLGTMVATGSECLPEFWWEAVMPGLAILHAILGFDLLGDGLRDMLDVELSWTPRARWHRFSRSPDSTSGSPATDDAPRSCTTSR